MEALSAFISIISIIAIVLVVGGLIAFIGHMIIGAFDGNKTNTKNENKGVIDYTQYKQLENAKQEAVNAEYNFEAINESKAQKEKEMLANEKEHIFELEEDKDDELEEIENRLKENGVQEIEEPVTAQSAQVEISEDSNLKEIEAAVENAVEENVSEEDEIDDFDLDSMLSEISEEVIEEEKSVAETEVKMSEELESYSIDELLKQSQAEDEEETEVDEVAVETEITEDIAEADEFDLELIDNINEEETEDAEEVETEDEEETEEVPAVAETNSEVEELKAQLAELNRQLELARTAKVEVVKIDITEEECVQKLEVLEERLKNVKKDYKINMKEYRPLKKVMNDLERYQTKLRRKEAIVAKKKVALYGVNNYVDIDKEKAEKLANELELLDGLRLSVSHCEEVINANKDRFPILEHSNQILESQISHLEADIAETQETLRKIREKNGNGEGNNESGSQE